MSLDLNWGPEGRVGVRKGSCCGGSGRQLGVTVLAGLGGVLGGWRGGALVSDGFDGPACVEGAFCPHGSAVACVLKRRFQVERQNCSVWVEFMRVSTAWKQGAFGWGLGSRAQHVYGAWCI